MHAAHTNPATEPGALPAAAPRQWWLTMKAVEYWEKSAMEAIADGAYADGLPLLQKAQVGGRPWGAPGVDMGGSLGGFMCGHGFGGKCSFMHDPGAMRWQGASAGWGKEGL